MKLIYYIIIFSGETLILAGFVYLLIKERKKKRIKKYKSLLETTTFSVKMPQFEEGNKQSEGGKDEKTKIAMMEQILSNFLNMKENERVSLEISSTIGSENISFYVTVPKEKETVFFKYVQGVYPGAQIEKISDRYETIFKKGWKTAAAFLMLEKYYFPINTYDKLASDPLSTITNALGKISSGEGASIQLVIRPEKKNFRKNGMKILSLMRKGKSFDQARAKAEENFFINLMTGWAGNSGGEKDKEKENSANDYDKETNEAIEEKVKKPVFEVNIRLVGTANDSWHAREILRYLEDSFSQFYSKYNSFKMIEPKENSKNHQKIIFDYIYRNFEPKHSVVLNIEELASIYHFPLSHIESPNIEWVKTKEVSPPAQLPLTGDILIGETIYRGENKPVYFSSRKDRRRHFYVIGQTGTGKTSLLREMIRQDIKNGEGVGVIDPHGDLIEDTLANIPKERIEDVVLFEPSDLERPVGLNMLEWDTPEQKDFAVSEMISIFTKLFPPEIIGPMFEHYMRNAMLALMADKENPGTLVEIPRMFTDKEFMEKKVEKVTDPIVRSFWLKEWAQTTGGTRSDMLGYVVSKVGRFIENEMMRNIIGQAHSGFDLEKIMNNKKIFLANLSKGLTGELNSSLLGLILVSKMQITAMKRGLLAEDERKDFYLYIDEFQNFTTDSIATILSEARKYRLNLILAHQFMPQLTDEIKNAVIGNVGNMGIFRVGADDADFLEKQLAPTFSKFDLLNLDNFQFIAKLMINSAISSPFKVKTIPPKEGDKKMIEMVRKISTMKYGRAKEDVEKEIMERSKLAEL